LDSVNYILFFTKNRMLGKVPRQSYHKKYQKDI
jgi:hypothetical protein